MATPPESLRIHVPLDFSHSILYQLLLLLDSISRSFFQEIFELFYKRFPFFCYVFQKIALPRSLIKISKPSGRPGPAYRRAETVQIRLIAGQANQGSALAPFQVIGIFKIPAEEFFHKRHRPGITRAHSQ